MSPEARAQLTLEREARLLRREQVRVLFHEGLDINEIAAAVGCTRGEARNDIAHLGLRISERNAAARVKLTVKTRALRGKGLSYPAIALRLGITQEVARLADIGYRSVQNSRPDAPPDTGDAAAPSKARQGTQVLSTKER